jgi:hypothetical protein
VDHWAPRLQEQRDVGVPSLRAPAPTAPATRPREPTPLASSLPLYPESPTQVSLAGRLPSPSHLLPLSLSSPVACSPLLSLSLSSSPTRTVPNAAQTLVPPLPISRGGHGKLLPLAGRRGAGRRQVVALPGLRRREEEAPPAGAERRPRLRGEEASVGARGGGVRRGRRRDRGEVRAGPGAGARRVRGDVPVHGPGHAGAAGLQVHLQAEAADPRRRGGRAAGGGHHAAPAQEPQHRVPAGGVRGRRRRAPRHGALRGRGALRPHRRQGPLHGARGGRGHAHHRRGRPALPPPRRHAPGPQARELPLRQQEGELAAQGHRLWPLHLLQAG